MSSSAARTVLRRFLHLAIVLALLLAPSGSWTSHHPLVLTMAEASRALELGLEIVRHGHVHADDPAEGPSEDRLPDHDRADHNHETPWSRTQTAGLTPSPARDRPGWSEPAASPATGARLERPPRPHVDG